MTRNTAREIAAHLSYELSFTDKTVEELLQERLTSEAFAELDGYIAKYAKNWKFSRIPLVASAIMRVAMYEILYMQDIPNGAAINEAVEIAKKYGQESSGGFVNAILAKIMKSGE